MCSFQHIYTPVFRRGVLWYDNVCPSIRPGLLQSQFSAFFSYMLWYIELKFYMSLSSYEHSIKFECRQFASFFVGVIPLLELKYWKYTVFRTFFLHGLTYWAEILHMTLFYSTTDQVQVLVICVNCSGSHAPFGTYNTWNTQFPQFSLTCFDIMRWNFAYDFVLLYYRSSSSAVNLHQSLLEFCPSWNLKYWK